VLQGVGDGLERSAASRLEMVSINGTWQKLEGSNDVASARFIVLLSNRFT
jgi:hypothetical protein